MITLANLGEATRQEIFDQVATHLLTQNKKSIDVTSGSCMYRGDGGLKCAAGCLIADEEYDYEEMEFKRWCDLARPGKVSPHHTGLIWDLQRIHDNTDVGEWKTKLLDYAFTQGLDTGVLNDHT